MTQPAATWTYDDGVLTHVQSAQSVTINIAANPALHLILSAQHWYLPPEFRHDYTLADPSDWVERDIKWNRASEDPPVLQIEQTIGAADHVDYTVYLLEDSPDFSTVIQSMTDTFNTLRTRAYTKADTRAFLKDLVLLMQKADLIGDSDL